jgi:hypothetical protein
VAAKNGTRTTHGGRSTKEYGIWCHIKERCNNTKSPAYPLYGGRGIRICEAWTDFAAFLADVGPRPSAAHSIDRIDSNGHYEPGNVRWATWKQQQRNRRNNRVVTFAGVTAPLSELCETLGLKYKTIHARLRHGFSIEEAMTLGRVKRRALNVTLARMS